jgi:sugar/nucleoside kinase (ribokinase family)
VSGRYDYATVGHVTLDVIEDAPGGPRAQPGGGAFYSALQAARLGLRTLIVTAGVPEELRALLAPYRAELDVEVLEAERTTTLATRGTGSARLQRVRAWAGPIRCPPPDASIVHVAPVARETGPGSGAQGAFVGLTPQGLVRSWGADGWVSPATLDLASLPRRLDAVVLSESERDSCRALLQPGGRARESGTVVAITAGLEPTELRLPDSSLTRVAAIAVGDARDDLGAGDVFAAAFFVSLAGGSAPVRAARYASAAAAVRLAGIGPAAVGDRRSIERLLDSAP